MNSLIKKDSYLAEVARVSDQKLESKRIATLDGFRTIAILLVLGFHFFTLFVPSFTRSFYYPYQNKYQAIPPFKYGYLGVHFFFMISGFVIFMTLKKSGTYKTFLLKRFTRLWPALTVCSIITFFFVMIVDPANHFAGFHSRVQYFIPSLTFTEPRIWTKLFHFKTMDYIDGVYWSLICEVKFYLLIGLLYFLNKARFFRNWMIYVSVMFICYMLLITGSGFIPASFSQNALYYFRLIFFPQYLIFFTLGIYFFMVFNGEKPKTVFEVLIALMLMIQLWLLQNGMEDVFIGLFVLLFITFLFKPHWLKPLASRYVTIVGLISYPIYLLHEKIGVILITSFSTFFNRDNYVLAIIPTMIIILGLSYLVHRTIELPANSFLKKLVLRGTKTKV